MVYSKSVQMPLRHFSVVACADLSLMSKIKIRKKKSKKNVKYKFSNICCH